MTLSQIGMLPREGLRARAKVHCLFSGEGNDGAVRERRSANKWHESQGLLATCMTVHPTFCSRKCIMVMDNGVIQYSIIRCHYVQCMHNARS